MDDPLYFIFPLLTCISFYQKAEAQSETATEAPADNTEEGPNNAAIIVVEDYCSSHDNDDGNLTLEESPHNSCSIGNIEDFSDESFTSHMSNIDVLSSHTDNAMVEDPAVNNETDEDQKEDEDNHTSKQFSVHQSNVLYFLFVISFGLIIGADLAIQKARWSKMDLILDSVTFKYLLVFIVNFYLWVDFTIAAQSKSVISLFNGKYDLVHNNAYNLYLVPASFLTNLLLYSTNIMFCVILLPFYAIRSLYRWLVALFSFSNTIKEFFEGCL